MKQIRSFKRAPKSQYQLWCRILRMRKRQEKIGQLKPQDSIESAKDLVAEYRRLLKE